MAAVCPGASRLRKKIKKPQNRWMNRVFLLRKIHPSLTVVHVPHFCHLKSTTDLLKVNSLLQWHGRERSAEAARHPFCPCEHHTMVFMRQGSHVLQPSCLQEQPCKNKPPLFFQLLPQLNNLFTAPMVPLHRVPCFCSCAMKGCAVIPIQSSATHHSGLQ